MDEFGFIDIVNRFKIGLYGRFGVCREWGRKDKFWGYNWFIIDYNLLLLKFFFIK